MQTVSASPPHHHHSASPVWEAHARAALAAQGSRAGGARQLVIAALAGQDCCASAQEIHARIAGTGGATGIASVYRTLDLLHGLSLITRIDTGDGGARPGLARLSGGATAAARSAVRRIAVDRRADTGTVLPWRRTPDRADAAHARLTALTGVGAGAAVPRVALEVDTRPGAGTLPVAA